MIQVANSIEIRRPVSQVFAFVADYRNNPRWMPIESVTAISNGPVGVGTAYKGRFFLFGAYYDLDCKITAFEPDISIVFTAESPVFRWRGNYAFQPSDTGTRLSAQGTVELRGPMRVTETMFAPKIRQLVMDTAPNLKRILENA